MDVYEAIERRRTVRDFERRSIDPQVVRRIIDAGLRAPSNNHLRQWEFVLVEDARVRLEVIAKVNRNMDAGYAERLIDSWGLTDDCQRQMYLDAIPKQYRMLVECGCLIIPCFRQESDLLKPESLSALNGFASIWCCIENMLLAATAENIYGVTRIPFDQELKHLREVLGIPGQYSIPCYLALGYPGGAERSAIRQHVVRAEDRIHFDRWSDRLE